MKRLWLPEDECRLTLLACLEALGPVTEPQLQEFVARLDLIAWFDMALNLAALSDQGQIARERRPAGLLLRLTEEGADALKGFRSRIPASRRALIDREAPAWRARFGRQLQAPCAFDGADARLMFAEDDRVAFEVRVALRGSSPAAVQARWEERAAAVRRAVTEALWGDGTIPEDMPAQDCRWKPLDSLTGLLTLLPASPGALSLRLALRDESDARRFARSWPACRDALERTVRDELESGG